MITSFAVENYRSIDERVELSLEASAAIKDIENAGYTTVGNSRVLNALAFFGANSSGKTNVFSAVSMMRRMVIQSVKLNDNESLPYIPFLLSDRPARVTRFELSFVDDTDKFVYGFSYTAQKIEEEWLIAKFPRRSLKTLLKRNAEGIEIDNVNYPEGLSIKEGNIPLNDNRLFVSLAAQLGGEISKRIIEWFRTRLGLVSGLSDMAYGRATKEMFHNFPEYRQEIMRFMEGMDVGFNEITTEQEKIDELKLPKGLPEDILTSLREHPMITAYARHNKVNGEGETVGTVNFDMEEEESAGTRKLFNLAGPIMEALREGRALFVDELNSQLHPLLSQKIVKLFNSNDTNPHGAQLIFTTHDTNLLSKKLLRRDQVMFVEKDKKYQMTRLTPMMEIKLDNGAKPRTDSNYEKNYLEGRYGAIPYFQSDFDGCEF